MEHNRTLALAARDRLCHALKVPPPCPAEMVGAMATLPLPDGNAEALQTALFHQFYIEVPIIPWPAPPQRFIRVSAQLYNTLADYERLAVALEQLLPVT